ncbi:T7SS effector LXG polymorphic toxin [Streptococcus macacae]|uniref:LXG domain-containing protein n=1 Tax=Streptococcus macacae NCTC 11558 TaxID=764298 RepID=G5JX91_9STRE|nr:T7SS effector LXG polymorphic toxin [Streptococcus macacae]EHJ52230.1 hypothetical protein STRMA_1960 [Streptococcus macacae NCTC 11558]SUN77864.1 membrane protein [Streptococcus macacae NCTC 11558]
MVKMVLGSSDTQASSVGTLADNYKAGFEQLVKSIDQLANEDRLSGSAYSNIKNYGSSVVKPLAQAFVLLAEAAKADIKKLPDEYRASVGSEDLDEETLTAQIHALNSTLATNRATKTAMKRIDSAADTQSFDQAISADEGTKRDLEEKLRKLREYNAKSSGFFSDIAGLESAVNTGLSQLQSGISGFNGTFTLPSKKELAWTKTIKSQWEKREAYQRAVAKVNKGEALNAKDAKAIKAYQKAHPNIKLDEKVKRALKQQENQKTLYEQFKDVMDSDTAKHLSEALKFMPQTMTAKLLKSPGFWEILAGVEQQGVTGKKAVDSILNGLSKYEGLGVMIKNSKAGKVVKVTEDAWKSLKILADPVKSAVSEGLKNTKVYKTLSKVAEGDSKIAGTLKFLGKGAKIVEKGAVALTYADIAISGVSGGAKEYTKSHDVGKAAIAGTFSSIKSVGPLEGATIGATIGGGPVGAGIGLVVGTAIWAMDKAGWIDGAQNLAMKGYDKAKEAIDTTVKSAGKAIKGAANTVSNTIGGIGKALSFG